MTWTSEKDEALCKEILLLEPFRFRPRTKESGTTWSQVAEDLRQIKSLNMTVDQRAVRDRYKILKSHFLQKMTEEENGSGIAPSELTPVEAALEEIIEKEKEFEKQCSSEDSDKKEKGEKDRKNGEEMHQESLETFAQTKKRKLSNSEEDDIETPERSGRTDDLVQIPLHIRQGNGSEERGITDKEEITGRTTNGTEKYETAAGSHGRGFLRHAAINAEAASKAN